MIGDEELAGLRAHLAENPLPFPVAVDRGLLAFHAYGVKALPTTIVVESDGSIVHRLPGWPPEGSELLIAEVERRFIDAETQDAEPLTPGLQGIRLTGRNPFGELLFDPVRQKIVVVEVGNFGVLDGGAEFIDPATLTAEGFFITETELEGDLNALRLYVDCTGYAIVTDSSFPT